MPYTVIHGDCFSWMDGQEENTITAVVTDPPYGVKEYTRVELEKQRRGKGGIWRIPPSFDGHTRKALPRFSDLVFYSGAFDIAALDNVLYSGIFVCNGYDHALDRIRDLALTGRPHMSFDNINFYLR